MKLDANVPHPLNLVAKVYLNNTLLKDCIVADEELGYVHVYVRDKYGELAIENDKMTVDTLYGVVRIEV